MLILWGEVKEVGEERHVCARVGTYRDGNARGELRSAVALSTVCKM